MATIKVRSWDGDVFDIDRDAAKLSGKVVENLERLDRGEEEPVEMFTDSGTLKVIIAWCTHHKDDGPRDGSELEQKDEDGMFIIDPWDREVLDVELTNLHYIYIASCFLRIDGLVKLTKNIIANRVRRRSS